MPGKEQRHCEFNPQHFTARSLTVGFDKTIEVRVGPTKQSFHLHESSLTRSSDSFKAALRNPMTKAATREIDLPEESPDAFNIYAEWLYGGSLPTNQTVSDIGLQSSPHFLIEPYLLGERLMDDLFLGHTEAAIFDIYKLETAARRWSDAATIACIYCKSPSGCKPRQIAIALGICWYSRELHELRASMNVGIAVHVTPELLEWIEDVVFAIAGVGHDPRQLAFALAEKVKKPKKRLSLEKALGQLRCQAEQLRNQDDGEAQESFAPETIGFGMRVRQNVLLGADKQVFVVHESYLTKSSEFFKAALRNPFLESQTRVIELPKEKAEDFQVYVQWLYSNCLPFRNESSGSPSTTSVPEETSNGTKIAPGAETQESRHLASTYLMAERLADDDFMTAIEVVWIDCFKGPVFLGNVIRSMDTIACHLYFSSAVGSKPRKVAIALFLSHFTHGLAGFRVSADELGETAVKRIQQAEQNPLLAEIAEDILFGIVGFGRDPKVLAYELLKMGHHSEQINANMRKLSFQDNLDSVRSRIAEEKKAGTRQNQDVPTDAEVGIP
ncbi:hypothetical protein FKW77_002595 [Venturia effusa]|uniref:BTB domain-containing protein n=1 Tax=Venturia effusa TaxID=50376 RepID=A0A517L6W8_9PEZI|nr:hypothetical protein FKW77_002595 [Venturia effusa]